MSLKAWKTLAARGGSHVRSVRSSQANNKARVGSKKLVETKRASKAREGPAPTTADSRRWEEKWRAESDMRNLAETAKILEEPKRLRAAKRVAMEQAEAAQEAANAVLNVKTNKRGCDGDE